MADGAAGVGNLSVQHRPPPLPLLPPSPPSTPPPSPRVAAKVVDLPPPPPSPHVAAKVVDPPPKRSWWARTKRFLANVKHRIVNATNKKYAYRRALTRNINGETANNRKNRLKKAREVTRSYFTKRGVKVPEYLKEAHANKPRIKNVVSDDFQRNGYWTRKLRGLKKWWGRRTGKVAPGEGPAQRENSANRVIRINRETTARAVAAEEAAAAAAAEAARVAERIDAIEGELARIDSRDRRRRAEGEQMNDEEAAGRTRFFGIRTLFFGPSKNYEQLRGILSSARKTNADRKEGLQRELDLLVAQQGALGAAAGEQGVRKTQAEQAVVDYILQEHADGENLLSKLVYFRAELEGLKESLAANGVTEDNVLFTTTDKQPITIKYIETKYIKLSELCISITAPGTTRGFINDMRELTELLKEEMRRINNFNPWYHLSELGKYITSSPIINRFLGENREILVNLRRILNHLLGLLEAV